ncbi:TPA: hypothetical protein JD369_004878 [Citrobacter freundii]|nr:hypothetical protein [Citrobacter freundii]
MFFSDETEHHAVVCITIHARKTHQRDSGAFSEEKMCGFVASAGKSRTARLSGARNASLW